LASEIRLRAAVEADAEAIHGMIAALAHETIGPHQRVGHLATLRRFGFGPEKCFDAIVAERSGAIVGTILVYDEFSSWRGEKGVYVLDIYVAAAARGEGVGRRLIEEAARWGRKRGASYVRLLVDEKNEAAMKFYRSLGFVEAAHDRIFVLAGDAYQKTFR
jgi:ribosomal protein S18 acetylase RimI-like enzyme